MATLDMSWKLVTKPGELKKAVVKPNLDAVVWQFSLTNLTEANLNDFAQTLNDTVTLPVILLTNNNNLSDRLKIIRLFNNPLLQQSSLSDREIKAIIKAIYQLKNNNAKVLIVDDDR